MRFGSTSNRFYQEARLAELRKKGFDLNTEIDSIALQLREENVEEERREFLERRQAYLLGQLKTVEEKLKDLYK